MSTCGSCKAALFLSGALFALIPAINLVPSVAGISAISRSDNPEAIEQRNTSAVGVILGEIRTNLGDMIFLKTERYLDNGIAYAPHIDANELAKSGETRQKGKVGDKHEDRHDDEATTSAASVDSSTSATIKPGTPKPEKPAKADHEDHEEHDKHVATLIKTADQDFRGFLGNLERNVKPWRDPSAPHQHTAGTELLPWYRMATYSDPKNVRMYMIGSWWLKSLRTQAQVEQALQFLDEGISHNPDSFQLYLMRGYVLRQLERGDEARKSFHDAVRKAMKTRSKDSKTSPSIWNEDLEEQLHSSMVMDILSVRDAEGTQPAHLLATDYADKLTPPNPVDRLKRQLLKSK